MTREQIDNLISISDYRDLDRFISDEKIAERFVLYFENEVPRTTQEEEELMSLFCRNIIQQIKDSGEYEYFKENAARNEELCAILLSYNDISPEEADSYKSKFNSKENIISVIAATHDLEYIKKYIDNNPELYDSQLEKLIKATNDKDYIYECVKTRGLDEYYNNKLIVYIQDVDYLDEYIKSQNGYQYEYANLDLANFIAQTNDNEYIKACLPLFKEFPKAEAEIVIGSKDKDLIKEFLSRENINYIEPDKIFKAISNVDEPEYIKQSLERFKRNLAPKDRMRLRVQTNDIACVLEGINAGEELPEDVIIPLGRLIQNEEQIEEMFGNENIPNEQKAMLSASSKKMEYIRKYVERFGIKEVENISKVVLDLNDKDFTKEFLENCEILNLDKATRLNHILSTNDENYIFDRINEGEYIPENFERIDLPEGITIGVEIEFENASIRGRLLNNWKAKDDGSLKDRGTEIVSPILKSDEQSSKDIYLMCGLAKEVGGKASERCGGHVHIGANYLQTEGAFERLLELWGNTEEIIFKISNSEGDISRKGAIKQYAMPNSKKIEEFIEQGTVNLSNEKDLYEFSKDINKHLENLRYYALNTTNIGSAKNTIEFRLSNGTLDPDTWIQNVNLYGGIISAAERIATIYKKQGEGQELTENEVKDLTDFEKLKIKDIDEREKLDSLLSLVVNEENKKVYETRYEVNSKLFEEKIDLKQAMEEKVATNPIKFKKEGIKEVTEQVTHIERENASVIFHRDLEEQREENYINRNENER